MSITREELENEVAYIAKALVAALPPGVGMALVLFDFGEAGSMAYASNGTRQDMIEMFRELLRKLEAKR